MNVYPDQEVPSAGHLAADPLTPDHLTDDQIDDHLIGDLAPAPAAHLAACTACTERVATAASPMANFQSVSTAWSERRSATLPIPVVSQQRPIWQRYTSWATASLTLAFGMAFLNATHQFSIRTVTTQPVPTAQSPVVQTIAPHIIASPAPALTETASIGPTPHTTQISADNHMLRAIDASFDPSADSPAALGLMPAAPSSRPPASIQD